MTALADHLTSVYSAPQVMHMAGINYRKLDYAIRCGVLRCDRSLPGSGHSRMFRPVDVDVAAVLGRLSDLGAVDGRASGGPGLRREVARVLYELPRPWAPGWLVVRPRPEGPEVFACGLGRVEGWGVLQEAQLVLRLPPKLEPLP